MVTRDHTAVQNRSCNKHGTGTWRDRERGGVWRWQRACSGVSERVARRQCGAVWRWQRESGGAWCAAHLTIERPTSTLPRYHAHQLVAGICRRVERRNRRAPHWRGRRHLCRRPPRRRFASRHRVGDKPSGRDKPSCRDKPMHSCREETSKPAKDKQCERQQYAAPCSLAAVVRAKGRPSVHKKRQKAAESGRKRISRAKRAIKSRGGSAVCGGFPPAGVLLPHLAIGTIGNPRHAIGSHARAATPTPPQPGERRCQL